MCESEDQYVYESYGPEEEESDLKQNVGTSNTNVLAEHQVIAEVQTSGAQYVSAHNASGDHSKNIQADRSKTSLELDNSKNYITPAATNTESIKIEFRKGAGNVSVTSESFKKDLQKRSQNISQHPDLSHLDNDFIPELPVLEEVENTKSVAKGKFSI